MPTVAYLSLGSNIGDREAQLRAALHSLQMQGRIVLVSSIYETEPVDVTDQPWFLNCAAALDSELTPWITTSLSTTHACINLSMGTDPATATNPTSTVNCIKKSNRL